MKRLISANKEMDVIILISIAVEAVGNLEVTAQKMKFSIKGFFSKCDQIRSKLRIWSHLLQKSLTENFIFCAVSTVMFPGCSEAVVRRCSVEKVFLKISQNSQENTSARVSFLIKLHH